MPEHHLSSLVVHAKPDALDDVSRRLEDEGCEIHARSEAGKLVVTLEAPHQRELSDALTRIQLLPGVLAATLVFHHVEEDEETQETPA
ncbi:chaperone NapD [Psychromarinibacter sp. C21-152]|uniref:Chaperone NapD n=1 Tax=Psychromarinibacter sediminicola TaxID=3033385 RepID=A0AAE3TB92_9RHOB|nr:chaperone NapD [Psychromarinibacter sediminicola]MDF0602440.1 chaperone NapD [Psychromarinibacter sediminicola]